MSITTIPRTINRNDVVMLGVTGRITLGEGSTEFRNTLRGLLAKGHKNVIVDLGNVSYIDSCGIGELFSAQTVFQNSGGNLKLLNLTRRVRDLLQITKLYTCFEIFDSEDAAIRSFGPPPATPPQAA